MGDTPTEIHGTLKAGLHGTTFADNCRNAMPLQLELYNVN